MLLFRSHCIMNGLKTWTKEDESLSLLRSTKHLERIVLVERVHWILIAASQHAYCDSTAGAGAFSRNE